MRSETGEASSVRINQSFVILAKKLEFSKVYFIYQREYVCVSVHAQGRKKETRTGTSSSILSCTHMPCLLLVDWAGELNLQSAMWLSAWCFSTLLLVPAGRAKKS